MNRNGIRDAFRKFKTGRHVFHFGGYACFTFQCGDEILYLGIIPSKFLQQRGQKGGEIFHIGRRIRQEGVLSFIVLLPDRLQCAAQTRQKMCGIALSYR